MGQLVCEEYPVDNLAYVYTYDKSGNITGKYEFPYYQGTLAGDYLNYLTQYKVTLGSYTYSSSSWGDMLANYNGTAITYDAIGNPNNWRNALSMSWDKRGLSSLTLNDSGTLNFVYNSDGIRTQKTYINGETTTVHNYVLDGTNVIYETVTENGVDKYTLYYLYDSSGSVTGFIYNNNPFYFQKNLQGDIVRILNPAGAVVTEYTYDAWGNVLSVTGTQATTIGQINPFRYRGYYYDTETGFYYLQSRYYDPTVGRCLNADAFVSTGQGILGNNMFAYCGNNPVIRADASGELWGIIVGLAFVATAVFTSCSTEDEHPTTGSTSACPSDYRQDNSRNSNCYSYAFDLPEKANPGDFYANRYGTEKLYDRKNVYTPDEVVEFVLNDMEYFNKEVRIVNSPSEKHNDEYIVALKTATKMDFLFGRGDYHFAVQLSDGTWADKRGSSASEWNEIDGEASVWQTSWIQPNYDSYTVYFAVKK